MLAKSIVFFSDRSYTRSGGRNLFLRSDLDRDGSLPLLELAALLHSLGLRPAAGDQSGELWRSAAERARRGAEQAAGQRAARGAAARHARPRASGVRREARQNWMGEAGRR